MDQYIHSKSFLITGLFTAAITLAGCGGGSSDPASDPIVSPTSRGIITGFGSTYINGVKYETDDSEFDVDDDDTASQDDLRIGHICTVYGTINGDGVTGTADKISCDNDIQGPISNKTPDGLDSSIGTMDILGTTIEVTADTRFEDSMTFDNFADGDCAEVSGFTTDSGISATFIEKQSDCDEIEITGEIADLTDSSFTVRGVTVNYGGTTELEDDIELIDGLYVEVKGGLDPADNTAVLAEKIEAEEDGKGEDEEEFETQGIVSGYVAGENGEATFILNSITVKVDATTEISPSSLDLSAEPEVEVEGYWQDGVLIAEEIEQKGKKIKIHAVTSSADATAGTITFTFGNTDVVVRVNHQTEMEDETAAEEDPLTLTNFAEGGGDFVELEAYNDGSADINAVELHRKDIDEIKIVAPVENAVEETQTVTLLGAEFDLTAADLKDEEGTAMAVADFFEALTEGVFIRLKDSENDTVIDKAELED